MIESPLLKEIVDDITAETRRGDIKRFLEARFGPIGPEVNDALGSVTDAARLDELIDWAARCTDLAAFRSRL